MRHNVVLEGYGCRLRPVTMEDAKFIVELRNASFAQGCIHTTSSSISAQEVWIQRYYERPGDYYWIAEANREGRWVAVGTFGLYDFSEDGTEAMPGRLVMYPHQDFLSVVPTLLVYDFAIRTLGLKRLIADTIATNRKVIKINQLLGLRETTTPARYAGTEEEVGASVRWFELTDAMWPEVKQRWERILSGNSEGGVR